MPSLKSGAKISRPAQRVLQVASAIAAIGVLDVRFASAQSTWRNPNTGNWSLGTNWLNNVAPASSNTTVLVFNATAGQSYTATQDIANPFSVNAINFNPAAASTINIAGGNAISFGGTNPAITMAGSGTVSIANPLTLAASTTLSGAGTGTIILSGAITSSPPATGTSGSMLTKSSSGNLALSGGATLYALRLSSGNSFITGGSYSLLSTQLGNDNFSGTNDGGTVSLGVGAAGSSASLTISGGAQVNPQNAFAGNDASSSGTITVSGGGSNLNAATRLGVNYGAGTIAMLSGATASAPFVELGRQTGSSGNLVVDGAGSTLTASSGFDAPLSGSASTIRVSTGGIVNVNNANANVGFSTDFLGSIQPSTVSMTITGGGSQFNVNGNGSNSGVLFFAIGDTSVAAAGTLLVGSGGLLHTKAAFFGRAAGVATVTINGTNSTFTNDGEFDMNSTAASSVTVAGGGKWTNGGNVFTSAVSTDNAQISVSGTNSLIDFTNAPQVQFSAGGGAGVIGGNTTVNINSAGEMRANLIAAAEAPGSRASITVDGANSKLTLQSPLGNNMLIVADEPGAIGTLNVSNGAQLNVATSATSPGLIFLSTALANGTLSASLATATISGAGSALNTGAFGAKLYIGGFDTGGGSTDGGTANLTVSSGATVDLKQLAYVGARGTLTVGSGATPASFKTGDLVVNGTVNFNSGTLVASNNMSVAKVIKLSDAARLGNGSPTNKKVLEAGALSFIGTGSVDLNDNDAIIHFNSLAQIENYVRTGRAAGAWTGTMLTSTAAKNNLAKTTGLGAITGTQFHAALGGAALFDGRPVVNSDVLVKYTYNGDSDFNGKVDGADYARVDSTFNNQATSGNIGGWFNGDFDYNGKVDGADYALIDAAFNAQGTIVLGLEAGGGNGVLPNELQTVPEPLGLTSVAMMGALGLRRRRR